MRPIRSLLMLALLSACTTRPENQPIVSAVEVRGNENLDDSAITEEIATRETPKFLGLVRGLIYDYRTYSEYVLLRDLSRVERIYHAHGYYQARARAGRVIVEDDDAVRVELVVEEGPQTVVRHIEYSGLESLPPELRDAAYREFEALLQIGSGLEETKLEEARRGLMSHLRNAGYARASVQATAQVDLHRNQAAVNVEARPGEPSKFGQITIRGLGPIPEEPVRRVLDLEPGEVYSEDALDSAEQALLDLGVFTSIRIEPVLPPSVEPLPEENLAEADELQTPEPQQDGTEGSSSTAGNDQATANDSNTSNAANNEKPSASMPEATTVENGPVPLEIEVQPAPLRTLRLGTGAELDVIRTEVHVMAGWEHKNFLGGLRRFSVKVQPGVVLFPTRVPQFDAPERLLPELKTTTGLEQPGFLEPRTHGFVELAYDIYPVLLSPDPLPDAPIIGYREFRGAAGVRRRFGRFTITPSHNLQTGVPFTYRGELIASAESVVISYLEARGTLDFRDDSVHPREGAFFLSTVQYAGVGGDARDVRLEPEARFYIPVQRDKSGFATRLKLGFLFPFNYQTHDGLEEPSLEDTQIAYFRSFFSGGPTSNRGYPYRGVGPHGAVSFFNPAIQQMVGGADCDPSSPGFDEQLCSIPLGGRSLWEASVSFRLDVFGPFSSALFCDASDVSEHDITVNLQRPHVSCGLGPRYDTPVGPIRIDLGYRIPGLQVLDETTRNEGVPDDILGLPINFSFGIGEAY